MDIRRLANFFAFLACVVLPGCVFNPYVTDLRVRADHTAPCAGSEGAESSRDPDAALKHAECVRLQMEKQVTRNAYLNSAGGVALIELASLATYRGIRGKQPANVSALTMGGAGLYGAMQWIYEKPREAIYLAGTGTLTCAIGQAQTVLRTKAELQDIQNTVSMAMQAEDQLKTIAAQADELETVMDDEVNKCSWSPQDVRTQTRYVGVMEQLGRVSTSDLETRFQGLNERHLTLLRAQGDTAQQLTQVTEAVRETVNRQLAALQPAPEELAGLLEKLKLKGLSGVAPADGKGTNVGKAVDLERIQVLGSRIEFGSAKPALICDAARAALLAADAESLRDSFAAQRYELETRLLTLEMLLPEQAEDGATDTDLAQRCPLARFGAPRPLSIVFASGQSSAIAKGKGVQLTIVGGQAPHTVRLMSERPEKERPTFEQSPGDQDTTRVQISTSDSTVAGRYTFIVNDRLGASQSFQIDVSDK